MRLCTATTMLLIARFHAGTLKCFKVSACGLPLRPVLICLLTLLVSGQMLATPATVRLATANCTSEEESDSRGQSGEEHLAGALGGIPPRSSRLSAFLNHQRLAHHWVAVSGRRQAEPRPTISNEHAGRNGLGAPLRC